MLRVMLLAGLMGIGLVACGGAPGNPDQTIIPAPDNVEPQVQDIQLTPNLKEEIRQVIREEMALIATSADVSATSTGFLPAHMHFALIEVINSVMTKLENQVSGLSELTSENAFSFDEFSYYLASDMGDLKFRVTQVENDISDLVAQIDCVAAKINRAERFEDIGNMQC